MGRPRKAGPRRRDGRLASHAPDRGNDFVVARRASFEIFQGGKASEQICDPIGRAWAVGLLDGTTQDSAILRDIGRKYADLHGRVYAATAVAIGELEPRSRGTGAGNDNDPTGERFAKLDALARDAGGKQRLAMRKLVICENPDEDPQWLNRLIWGRTPGWTGARAHNPSFERDHMIMTQALAALVAMVEG